MKRPDVFIAYLNSVKGTLEHELETAKDDKEVYAVKEKQRLLEAVRGAYIEIRESED